MTARAFIGWGLVLGMITVSLAATVVSWRDGETFGLVLYPVCAVVWIALGLLAERLDRR